MTYSSSVPFFALQVLQNAFFMPETESRKEIEIIYDQTKQALDDMEKETFREWSQSLDDQYFKKLEQPIMVRSTDGSSMLSINFNKWVTQLRKILKAFTLKYRFTQCLTLYTVVCILTKHKTHTHIFRVKFALMPTQEVNSI